MCVLVIKIDRTHPQFEVGLTYEDDPEKLESDLMSFNDEFSDYFRNRHAAAGKAAEADSHSPSCPKDRKGQGAEGPAAADPHGQTGLMSLPAAIFSRHSKPNAKKDRGEV